MEILASYEIPGRAAKIQRDGDLLKLYERVDGLTDDFIQTVELEHNTENFALMLNQIARTLRLEAAKEPSDWEPFILSAKDYIRMYTKAMKEHI